MKEKTIALFLISSIIVLLILITSAQYFLFSFGENNFVAAMESAIKYADAGDWEKAQLQSQKVEEIWNRGNFIVAVKYAESDFTFLNVYLTRFHRAILQKDAKEVAKEGLASLYIYNNITSISPKP